MARASWINDDDHPLIDEHLSQLEHFTQSIADGVVDKDELEKQEQNLITAMKAVEDGLSDEQHEKVTKLLAELSAYNVMATLHGLAAEHAKQAFAGK
ncbi:MAG: hypothetical protein KJO07_00310 [Deltaproteobacteria bacterium]|jgi:predicted transcriptional regulator|nr:hypothetical protein [Deltaproteobacteria bacterium]